MQLDRDSYFAMAIGVKTNPEAVEVEQVEDLPTIQKITEHEETIDDEIPLEKVTLRTWVAILSLTYVYTLSLGYFLIISSIITDINADIGPSPSYTWIASVYPIASGVGFLITGTVSDLIGRRWFAVMAPITGAIGGLIGALAQNVDTVIVAMTFHGLMGANCSLMIPMVCELVPSNRRGIVLGSMNVCVGFFTIAGSYIGHLLVHNTAPGWRTIFWIVFASMVPGIPLLYFTYSPGEPPAATQISKKEVMRNFDWVGLFLVTAGPLVAILGITWLPTYGPKSAFFITPFVVGMSLCILLAYHQVYVAKSPLLHPKLFKRVRTFTMLLVIGCVGGMLFYSMEAFFPIYLQTTFDLGKPIQVGIDGMPFGAGTNVGSVLSAMLLTVVGRKIGTNWYLAIGVLFQTLFIPLMYLPCRPPKVHGADISFTDYLKHSSK